MNAQMPGPVHAGLAGPVMGAETGLSPRSPVVSTPLT